MTKTKNRLENGSSFGFKNTNSNDKFKFKFKFIPVTIGAITYAELGANFDASGGDYIIRSKLMHPLVGYVYAWVSLTVLSSQ